MHGNLKNVPKFSHSHISQPQWWCIPVMSFFIHLNHRTQLLKKLFLTKIEQECSLNYHLFDWELSTNNLQNETIDIGIFHNTVCAGVLGSVTQPRVGAAEVESLSKEYECCCVMGSVTGHCIPVVWPLHGFRRVLVLWWVLTRNQSWANDHSLS